MAVIEIYNIDSVLKGATPRALVEVNEALAAPVPNHQFSQAYQEGRWDGYKRFFSVQTGKFPTGLLTRVYAALKRIGERVELEDMRDYNDIEAPDKIQLLDKKLGTLTLRDYQMEAVAGALKATRGVINIATNGGKTEIACGIMKTTLPHIEGNDIIGFFTHSTEIFYQTQSRIEERLGMKVGIVGDGKWDVQKITVVMIPTVNKYLEVKPQRGMDPAVVKQKVKDMKVLLKSIKMLIVDEAHHSSSDVWYDVLRKCTEAVYRIGLTGTIDHDDEISVLKLYASTGKIIKKVTNKFLIENGYSAEPVINIIKHGAPKILNGDMRYAVDKGIIYNDVRNAAFCDKVLEETELGNHCLIIVNEITHGNVVHNMLQLLGIEAEFTNGECTKKYRKEVIERFKAGEIPVLIATSIFDEGVDISGIEALFLMAGGKGMRQLLQRIGRGLRKKADGSGINVYDALDTHHEILLDHSAARNEIYKAEGFKVVKVK